MVRVMVGERSMCGVVLVARSDCVPVMLLVAGMLFLTLSVKITDPANLEGGALLASPEQ